MNVFGNLLRETRKRKGLTQQQIADKHSSLTQISLCNWETGRRLPEKDKLANIAKAYGLPLETVKEKYKGVLKNARKNSELLLLAQKFVDILDREISIEDIEFVSKAVEWIGKSITVEFLINLLHKKLSQPDHKNQES